MRSRLRLPASSSHRTTLAEGIVEFGKQVAGNFAEHRMPTYAAALAYGSLGAAVGLLVYLNLTAAIVLAGAEPNAAMHPLAASKTGDA